MEIHHILYNGIMADSLYFGLGSDPTNLSFTMKNRLLEVGPVSLKNLLLDGKVESNHVESSFHVLDEKGEDRYLFGGIFISLKDHYRFMFTPGEFITNYNAWEVRPSNAIDFYPDETWISNLFLTQGEQELRIFSETDSRQDTLLNIDIHALKLEQFGNITSDSLAIVSGLVEGNTKLNLLRSGLAFTSDLGVSNLSYRGDTLGNLDMFGDTKDGLNYDLDVKLSGDRNDIRLLGNYQADSAGIVDMNLDVNKLELSTVEAFVADQLSELKGYVNGQAGIKGMVSRPDISGDIRFNSVSFRTVYLGALMQVDGQQLHLDNSGLHFDRFRITDGDGDVSTLTGDITTDDFFVFDLDLQASFKDFNLINRPLPEGIPSSENPVYGVLDVTSDISVKGTSIRPSVELTASFSEGSNFAYVIPEATLSEQEQKDVVEWFDQDVEDIQFFKETAGGKKDSVQGTLQGIDLRARINVKSTNELAIVIDPVTGDKLTVKGNSTLNYVIRPSGSQTLSGRFEVTDGSYVLNFYNLFKREFKIQTGSYMLWTGDPLNAIMNVTALYEVRAAPVGINTFQGKLDFLVYLDIKGILTRPEISFRLGLAPDAAAPMQVEAWVNQQNALPERVNKQVFGLLLFQTFFPDDSFVSAGNVNVVENTARSSVSGLLSSQLNRLSNQIEGLDLSIDLDSYQDYTASGDSFGRTELELGVSKELFNERVVVKLAGNVDLEGNRSRQGVSDFAGDLQIEYKLTEDGRFRLVGFRNNDFDNLQGEIIRTGVGVIYVREYTALKELFQFSQKNREQKRDE